MLAPRTAEAIDLCVGEREEGPILLNYDGTRRLDRHAATRIVKRLARRAGIEKKISPLGTAGSRSLVGARDRSGRCVI